MGVSIKKVNKYIGSFINSVLKVIPIEETTPLSMPNTTANIVVTYIAPKDKTKKTTKSINNCDNFILAFLKKSFDDFLQYSLNKRKGNTVPSIKHNKDNKNSKL